MAKYSELNLGQIEALGNKVGGMDGIMGILSGALIVVKNTVVEATEKLLKLLTTFKVGRTEKFVARENFKKDTSAKAKVRISFIWDDFKENFLDLIEENVSEVELKVHKLVKGSRDPEIIAELSENHKTFLAHVWNALLLQPNGEPGNLLTNGHANIFYVADKNGFVRAVRVRWFDDGWHVGAFSVGYQYEWRADYQVLSR